MLKLTNPRLRRSDVVVNSFNSCVSNTPKEFSRAPEMPFSKMSSKPRMLLKKAKSAVALKQLKSLANTNSRRKFNKQVDVISPYVQLINPKLSPISHLSQEKLTIHPKPIKLEGIHCIFNFPHEVKSILSEAVLPRFQIHFLSPKPAHANFTVYFEEPSIQALPDSQIQELNLMEDGDSSLL